MPAYNLGFEHMELTRREREVAGLVACGKSSKEIAAKLFISAKTADTHRSNIMRKLRCSNVVHLTLWAVRNGLVNPETCEPTL